MRERTAPGSPASTGEQPAHDHDLTRAHPDGGPGAGDPTVAGDAAAGLTGGVADGVDTDAEVAEVDSVGVTGPVGVGGAGTADRTDGVYPTGSDFGDGGLTLRPHLVRADGSVYKSLGATGTYTDDDLTGATVGATAGTATAPGGTAGAVHAGPGAFQPAVGSASVPQAVRPVRSTGPRGPRRARLTVRRVDPWSVMKFSFIVSLVMFVVMIVATSVLYMALDAMGVFTSFNTTVADLMGGGFQLTARAVIGTAAALGGVNVLLFTALATLSAFIYNVCADLVGGIEVTLAERE